MSYIRLLVCMSCAMLSTSCLYNRDDRPYSGNNEVKFVVNNHKYTSSFGPRLVQADRHAIATFNSEGDSLEIRACLYDLTGEFHEVITTPENLQIQNDTMDVYYQLVSLYFSVPVKDLHLSEHITTSDVRFFYMIRYKGYYGLDPIDISVSSFQLIVKRFDDEKNVFSGEFDLEGSLCLLDKKSISFDISGGEFDIRINSSLVTRFEDWTNMFPDDLCDIVIPDKFSDEDDQWSWSLINGGRNSGVY